MAFIVKASNMENESGINTEQEFIEFMSSTIKGVKNEYTSDDIRGKRNRQINQPTQSQSKRRIADSGSKETTPF
jgi:hypothetical protein